MKYNPNKGYKYDWIDLCMDGMSSVRRIKGKDKKMMQHLTRKRLQNAFKKDLAEMHYE